MEFKELLKHRKSTRAFTGEAVTRAQLDEMLDCGIHAPNACNAQSWHFFCSLDKKFINGLVPDVYKGQWITDAGCIILLCTDPGVIEARFGALARERFAVQDTAAAATQILQCATVLGLSGCWLGAFDHDKARDVFDVPMHMEPVIILAIGKAVTEPPMRPRKQLSEVVTIIGDCEKTDDSVIVGDDRYIVRGTQLKDALFDNMKMSNAVFNHSVMANAVFDDINMAGTKFNNINLEGAAFTDINLKNSTYGGLTMEGARFACVDMQNAVFANPDLSGTRFEGCSLRGVSIDGCDIEGLKIDGVDISELMSKHDKDNK